MEQIPLNKRHRWVDAAGNPAERRTDIDIFAYDNRRYCNGPLCYDCGYTGCHHCYEEIYDEICPSHNERKV